MMCEQLGQEPKLEEMPPEMGDFPLEIQEAFVVHAMLPDRWDGMSGSYMGKDWSALEALLKIQGVDDKKTVCFFLKNIESYSTMSINAELKRKQDASARRAKAKR
tara:strand:+ start:2037 stop:2351 length:315 start_codon:yes stop_codon:yes gene_type:complete